MMVEKEEKYVIDEELKDRLESIIRKIASLDKVIKKVDKPSWRRINGYLKTSRMKVAGYTGVMINDALDYCEQLETQMYLASKNVRFDKHKLLFQKVSNEVVALKLAIQLTK